MKESLRWAVSYLISTVVVAGIAAEIFFAVTNREFALFSFTLAAFVGVIVLVVLVANIIYHAGHP